MIVRQGDVLLVATYKSAIGAPVQPENGRLILSRGEATGHHHSVGVVGATLFRPDDAGHGTFALLVEGDGIRLEHQEHDPVALPSGFYRQMRQVEEYPAEAPRAVVD